MFILFAEIGEPTVTTILLGGLSALAGCVAHLYRNQSKAHAEAIARADECDDDRRQLWVALARIDPNAKELNEI